MPAEYTLDLQQARDGTAPGCSLDDGVLFRSSLTAQTWIGILAPLLGVARGACDAFIGYTRTKISTFGEKVAEGGPMQIAIGESLAELDAAFALAERVNEVLFAEQPMTLQLASAIDATPLRLRGSRSAPSTACSIWVAHKV